MEVQRNVFGADLPFKDCVEPSTGVRVRACVPEVSDSQAQTTSSRTGLGNAADVHEIPSCRSALKHVSAKLAKLSPYQL